MDAGNGLIGIQGMYFCGVYGHHKLLTPDITAYTFDEMLVGIEGWP